MRVHNAVNHSVRSAAQKVGIDTHAHGLRHTAVSLMIREGHTPPEVQRFIGHSDIREPGWLGSTLTRSIGWPSSGSSDQARENRSPRETCAERAWCTA